MRSSLLTFMVLAQNGFNMPPPDQCIPGRGNISMPPRANRVEERLIGIKKHKTGWSRSYNQVKELFRFK